MTTPLAFEDRFNTGHKSALLGVVEVGYIIPTQDPEVKFSWRFMLPPMVMTRYVKTEAAAKRALNAIATDWLKAAGLNGEE